MCCVYASTIKKLGEGAWKAYILGEKADNKRVTLSVRGFPGTEGNCEKDHTEEVAGIRCGALRVTHVS